MNELWVERCGAQRVRRMEGTPSARLVMFGFVAAWDGKSAYPLGCFEKNGAVEIYPAQTLNTLEEESMLAAVTGLIRMWDKTGIAVFRFVKQPDGSDFALLSVDEELTREAEHLLTLRGLKDWWNAMKAGGMSSGCNQTNGTEKEPVSPPVLEELAVVGVSVGGTLLTGVTVREALMRLPVESQSELTGWYRKVLNL